VGDVFVIRLRADQRSLVTESGAVVRSGTWTIEEIVGRYMSAEDLLSAIDAAIDLAGGSTRVRYHMETGLLLGRGPQDELDLIHDVINRAQQSMVARANSIDLDATVMEYETQLQELDIEKGLAIARLEQATDIFAEAEELAKSGHISERELSASRFEIKVAEAEIQKIDGRINRTRLAARAAIQQRDRAQMFTKKKGVSS